MQGEVRDACGKHVPIEHVSRLQRRRKKLRVSHWTKIAADLRDIKINSANGQDLLSLQNFNQY